MDAHFNVKSNQDGFAILHLNQLYVQHVGILKELGEEKSVMILQLMMDWGAHQTVSQPFLDGIVMEVMLIILILANQFAGILL